MATKKPDPSPEAVGRRRVSIRATRREPVLHSTREIDEQERNIVRETVERPKGGSVDLKFNQISAKKRKRVIEAIQEIFGVES